MQGLAKFDGLLDRTAVGMGVWLLLLAAISGLDCAGRLPMGREPEFREVTVRAIRPPSVNLYDRGIEALGIIGFAGSSGTEIASRLAVQLEKAGAFRVLDPGFSEDRLMKAGLSVGWDAAGSSLRWVHERTALDGIIVGRVEVFRVEERKSEKETLSLQGTGEYGFVVTDEGKIAYREKKTYRRAQLFCRSDHGTVAASYRIWDLKRGEEVATRHHELSTEMSSFCYRGDVPERLKAQASSRLLEKLFLRLNEQFLADLVPRTERTQIAFEVLSAGRSDASLMQRNELGILYASRGDWNRAIEMWQDCLIDRPNLAAAHYNLAMVFRATARLSLASEHLKKALALAPSSAYQTALAGVPQERNRQ